MEQKITYNARHLEISRFMGFPSTVQVIICSYFPKAEAIHIPRDISESVDISSGYYIVYGSDWLREMGARSDTIRDFLFGHEIAHFAKRHLTERSALDLRVRELEADGEGACVAAQFGGDWMELESFLLRFRKPGLQAQGYPSAPDSIDLARKRFEQCGGTLSASNDQSVDQPSGLSISLYNPSDATKTLILSHADDAWYQDETNIQTGTEFDLSFVDFNFEDGTLIRLREVIKAMPKNLDYLSIGSEGGYTGAPQGLAPSFQGWFVLRNISLQEDESAELFTIRSSGEVRFKNINVLTNEELKIIDFELRSNLLKLVVYTSLLANAVTSDGDLELIARLHTGANEAYTDIKSIDNYIYGPSFWSSIERISSFLSAVSDESFG